MSPIIARPNNGYQLFFFSRLAAALVTCDGAADVDGIAER